jgi:hypothetical protein
MISEPIEMARPESVMMDLGYRVVREAMRETWFVVNEGSSEVSTIPIELETGRSLRRVHANGEVAEFSASEEIVLVRPRRPLRSGAGTIVVLHYR